MMGNVRLFAKKPDRGASMPTVSEVLKAIEPVDVCRGIVDIVEGAFKNNYESPKNWGFRIAGHELSARAMVAFAAFRSVLRVPIGTIEFTGSTDELCRNRLIELGFEFHHK
jgi:hypothetical protein